MKFNEAEKSLKEGKKIKLKSWKNAYWYYDQENGVIMNHFEEDGSPDVPTSALFPRDILWVMGNDWEIVGEETAAVPAGTYSFGDAINSLKAGKKVARKGWNGKGMFLVLCPGSEVPADHMRVKPVKKFYQQEGRTSVIIAPHIDLKAADGTYVTGWLASQTDMLADDWFTVE